MDTVIIYKRYEVDENGERKYEHYTDSYYPVDFEDFLRVVNVFQEHPAEYEIVFKK